MELRGNLPPTRKSLLPKGNARVIPTLTQYATISCAESTTNHPSWTPLRVAETPHGADLSPDAWEWDGDSHVSYAYHARCGFADGMDGVASLEAYECGDELDPDARHYAAGVYLARLVKVLNGGRP